MRCQITRATAVLVLFASLAASFAHSPRMATAQSDSSIIRTITYRDLMPPDGPEPIENYYLGTAPVLSADGTTAVYTITRPDGPDETLAGHVYLFDIASQTATEIDTTGYGPLLDISDDGSTVLTMHQVQAGGPRLIRIANASGAQTVAEEKGTELVDAVLSGDGSTVYLVLGRDGTLTGIDGMASAGLWAVNADGSNLRQLASTESVRDFMNAEADDLIFFSNYAMQIDASSDGNRAVFSAINYRTGEYFAFSLEGENVSLLGGPFGMLTRLAISGDGSTVLSLTAPYPHYSAPSEYAISNPDGSDRKVLATGDKLGDRYEKGTQLNEDGSRALLGSTGILIDTESGETISLSVGCGALSGGPLPNLTMDGSGNRFLYLSNDSAGSGPLTLLELNPSEPAPGIPAISDVTIDPDVITAGDGSASTVSATIETTDESSNCVLALNGMTNEAFLGLGVANYPMVDDGTLGDTTAGDGTYSVNTLQASASIVTGPRTIRIKVESQDAEGYRSAMVVDVEPFTVIGVMPTEEPSTPEVTTDPNEEPADDEAGDETPVSEETRESSGSTGDWSDWEGEPSIGDCTAPVPSADDLVMTVVQAAAEPPSDDLMPLQVDSVEDLPAGEPLDDETTAAALDTVWQLGACINAGSPGFFGIFTPSGLAALAVFVGLPLQPLDEETIQDLEANAGEALAEDPVPVAESERTIVKEIQDVRLLPDGRVLVIAAGIFPNGEQLGYLVLEDVDGRWLIDYIGVVGDPIEVELSF